MKEFLPQTNMIIYKLKLLHTLKSAIMFYSKT